MSTLNHDLIDDAELHHRALSDHEYHLTDSERERVATQEIAWHVGNPIRSLCETATRTIDTIGSIIDDTTDLRNIRHDDAVDLLIDIRRKLCGITGDAP